MNGAATTGGALGDVIGDIFDIPEMQIVEQAEETFTIGQTETTTEADVWNPLADF